MNMNPQESAISLAACGKLIALGLAAIGVDLLIIKAVNTHYFQLAIIGGFFLMVGVVALVGKGMEMLARPFGITRQHFLGKESDKPKPRHFVFLLILLVVLIGLPIASGIWLSDWIHDNAWLLIGK